MPAPDPSFDPTYASLDSPASILFAITPGTGDLTYQTRGLYVGTGGTLVVVDTIGNEVVLTNVPDGAILPIRVDKVLATQGGSPGVNTTASGIVGLY